jgi:hypothetical protein
MSVLVTTPTTSRKRKIESHGLMPTAPSYLTLSSRTQGGMGRDRKIEDHNAAHAQGARERRTE